jgi:hypothetical protein
MFTQLFRAVWIFGSIVDDLEPVDNPVADENSVFAPRYHYSTSISKGSSTGTFVGAPSEVPYIE